MTEATEDDWKMGSSSADLGCDGPRAASASADWVKSADPETVWRVCRVITGKCERCSSSENRHGDDCTRGCYLQAVECVNTVETGNPWRKTANVKPPWIVHRPAHTTKDGR